MSSDEIRAVEIVKSDRMKTRNLTDFVLEKRKNGSCYPLKSFLSQLAISPRNDLDERRDFMLSAEKQPHPIPPVRQAPGRKLAGKSVFSLDFPAFFA